MHNVEGILILAVPTPAKPSDLCSLSVVPHPLLLQLLPPPTCIPTHAVVIHVLKIRTFCAVCAVSRTSSLRCVSGMTKWTTTSDTT